METRSLIRLIAVPLPIHKGHKSEALGVMSKGDQLIMGELLQGLLFRQYTIYLSAQETKWSHTPFGKERKKTLSRKQIELDIYIKESNKALKQGLACILMSRTEEKYLALLS